MKTILFIIALVLILIWTIGFIGYRIGGVFNGILILALILEGTGVIWELRHTRLEGNQEAQINHNQVN